MPERPLVATYRVQLRNGTTLDDVADETVLADLADLGISHLYLSPILSAVEGSTHGYDVVDHSRVDPALGGDAALRRLADAAHRHDLGLVVDIVPNHMAVDHAGNRWWWDVLRNGRASRHAPAFDIDWEAPEIRLQGLVTLPVLPDHLGREIEAGAFHLEVVGGEVVAHHPATTVPLEPSSVASLIGRVARRCGHADTALDDLADDLWALPPFDTRDQKARLRRQELAPELRRRLTVMLESADVGSAMAAELDALAADPDRLDELLLRQPYRLLRWRSGSQDLAYRRFFDVTGLVALRIDRPEVFELTHATALGWVEDGLVDGLRVDHPDGLRDPLGYFTELRAAAPDAWLVAEKILEPGERLRSEWPVDGTTGYDVAELVGRLHLDDRGRPQLSALAAESGIPIDVAATVVEATSQVLDEVLASDLAWVSNTLLTVCQRHRRIRDFTRPELHQALAEMVARYDVYRTYVRAGEGAGAEDRATIEAAISAAREARPQLDPELFELLGSLLCEPGPTAGPEADLRGRLQQLTGPAKAKGKEDTAWYRLVTSLHRVEVGADADAWELPLDRFHDEMSALQQQWPTTMTALSTHDSKRSEDVRARLAVLTEMAEEWVGTVERWRERLGRPTAVAAPDATAELTLLQSLVGAHPLGLDRALAYLRKAAREAKIHTSWLEPDAAYEEHLDRYVRSVLGDPWMLDELQRLDDVIRVPGRRVALAQKAVQLTVPGVPDLYQGSEHWLLRLVDPDNREPLDLAGLHAEAGHPDLDPAVALGDPLDPGTGKAALVRRALRLRRGHPDAFGPGGSYEPVWAAGPSADHVVAYRRGEDVVIVTARKMLGLTEGWRDTYLDLPVGRWCDDEGRTVDGGRVELDELLGWRPAVMLEREAGAHDGPSDMKTGAVWAPAAGRVRISVDGEVLEMERDDRGIWHPARDLGPGESYGYRLDDDRRLLPDPRSRWQPDGVDGRSRVVDPDAHRWRDAGWSPPSWEGAVVYEVHVGTFSRPGTFLGAIEHLDHLVELGVTHVELMPLAAAPGRFGWGYDGVAMWAPHPAYGTPDELRELVDACHGVGLAVLVDVVLNHLGPAGAHLVEFGPYFTDRYRTPWGDGYNVDGPDSDEVRAFLLGSAEQWMVDHHADGLRVDAAHAVIDTSAVHLLEELDTRVDELADELGRPLVTVAEWDRADPRIVTERELGGDGFDAQWADDLHHALHGTLTGERAGYYEDFDGGAAQVADVLTNVYAFRGTWSRHHRRHVGRDPGDLPRDRFVVALQNHDQVGNRAAGERLSHLVDARRVMTAAALVLLSPQTPLLFQGEEWAASSPFPYFADHGGELGEAIRRGRLAEFEAFGWDGSEVIDPISAESVEMARLRWDELDAPEHVAMLAWYRSLLDLRRETAGPPTPAVVHELDGLLTMERGRLSVVANLAADRGHVIVTGQDARLLTDGVTPVANGFELEPGSCVVLA